MHAERHRATFFLLAALAWSFGLFALLRSPWVEGQVVLPLTRLQEQAAIYFVGRPAAPVAVTAACSGTDVIALCLAAILACPVPWRARLAGAAGGVAVILALNTLRIATLGRAAASPALFQTLHVQVWPAILILATSGYVFAWMWATLGTRKAAVERATREGDAFSLIVRRFAPWAAVLLVAFALSAPWIARSRDLFGVGAWMVRSAAFLLAGVGVSATAVGNLLTTSRGAFLVTPECIASALIPLYLAGVFAARLSWPRRGLAVAAALPLFALLGVARLLVLALPPVIADSPLFLVHGFHQLVLAVAGVALLAFWREPLAPGRWARAARRAAAALGAAVILAALLGHALTTAVFATAGAIVSLDTRRLAALAAPGDAQGALALLPVYQVGLLVAIGVTIVPGWRRLLSALALLLVSQVVVLAVLGALAAHAGFVAHALPLRAWAVAVPVVLALVLWRAGRPPTGAPVPLRPAVDGPV